ncbi:two component transcriptional regulator, AraC family [Caldicellulosiruptor obsidiansis OB47]|uniref:Two component transcriptional regulator, AraC family n=2 Tax=Caldicellulosiruptor TaxID=44000 RepID=D9THA7_CALOO|nr:response regulator [Caldicellulosiruptor obsidiansis]ADL41472.1 two component transcriptional regulator, AraC family [Caldicellulosiruptor obsidiansis OB47]
MKKILICDDESIVIESISHILRKNFSEQMTIDEAYDGEEALQKLMFENYHIVFIDIQMPDMSGIEVMEEIRKTKKEPFPLFIIISAHDKFEYARKSVELGAFSYILKPYLVSDIVNITKKAFEEIDNILSKQKEEMEKKRKIKAMQSLIENGLLFFILNNKLFSDLNLRQIEQFLEIQSLQYGIIAIVRLEQENTLNNIDILNDLKTEIKSAFSNKCVVSFLSPSSLLCIFSAENETYKDVLKDKLQKIIKAKTDAEIQIGLSSLCNLYDDFEEAFYESYSNIISDDNQDVTDLYVEIEIMEKRLLNSLLKTTNIIQKQQQISELIKKYITAYGINQARYKVILFVIQLLIEINIKESAKAIHVMEKFLKDIITIDNENELTQKSSEIIQIIISEAAIQKKTYSSSNIVSQAIEYIKNNFKRNISLEEMSQVLNISPYYFSKIFKKSVGINFKEYLIKMKIEHAQKLLIETNMPIKEIAYEVGFDDPNYFIKAFKKYTGSTPASVRNRNK